MEGEGSRPVCGFSQDGGSTSPLLARLAPGLLLQPVHKFQICDDFYC